METADLILAKAKFEDWKSMYRNIWSRPESAQYMQWNLTQSEEDARRRIERNLGCQCRVKGFGSVLRFQLYVLRTKSRSENRKKLQT